MTVTVNKVIKRFLLWDFISAFGTGMKYFVRRKATINYPHENAGFPHAGFYVRWAVGG